jgi:hypothetical protein
LAIISDYDLTIQSELGAARQTLDILKADAEAEEISGFDASASSGVDWTIPEGPGGSNSTRSLPEWASTPDNTSLSQDLSSLELDGYSESSEDKAFGTELDGLDEEGKVSLLSNVFPVLSEFSIRFTLKKYKWDANLAVDDLMTQAFLEANGGRPRGIEAFSESDLTVKSRKRKGKKKVEVGGEIQSPVSPTEVSKWDTATDDMQFISRRTGVPLSQVSSMYHKNGASVLATLSAIITAHQELKVDSDDPLIHSKVIDLAHEFPSLPSSTLEAIVQITHPSDAYAHDLAKALAVRPNNKPNIQIQIRQAPIQLDPAPSPAAVKPYDYGKGVPLEEATAKAAKYYQVRDASFQQASAAYRRGKSDHLMGGVSAYYAQQGRDADALARNAQSAAADALVARQSSRTELDLHNLNVHDAKRITKERVTTWWHELGTTRGGPSYYKIVIGRGNHSDRGVAKIGPAVGKMLIRDGWKVEVGDNNGILNVMGLAKKK